MTIAVTGATGLVGSRLVSKLAAQGHKVRVLTRNVNSAKGKLTYPGLEFYGPNDWEAAICGCTGVVNLAGEPISTRWTEAMKQEIKRSRVNVTKRVAAAINACDASARPAVLVSASAVGYYGVNQNATFNESSPSGNDYLAEVCREWEAAANEANTRVVIMRNGIVLAREGGAIGKMLPIFTLFAGGPLGTGRQWCSWIHRDDLVNMIVAALANSSFEGVVNATAPNPVRMGELCSNLGQALGRPSWLPVPEFAVQTLLGEGAVVVLEGQRVLPSRAQDLGFTFQYTDVLGALRNILRA